MIPLVSIACITYNHAPYIRQCLEGFMIQDCDFDFEVLIYDDASTDGTQVIIKEFQEKYPHIFKPVFQTENQFSQGVRGIAARFVYPRAQGKYIALCEGDDYWTDPLKLQKQVDFMEANPEYSFTATNHSVLSDKGLRSVVLPERIDTSTVFLKNRVATASLVFRKGVVQAIATVDFSQISAGDWFIQAYACVNFNPGYVLPYDSCVYRVHNGGAWSQLDRKEMGLKGVDVLEKFKIIFNDPLSIRQINNAIKLRKKEFGLQKNHSLSTIIKKLLKL